MTSGCLLLVFDEIEGDRRENYFAAVRAGTGCDYEPMQGIFERIIARSRSEF